MFPPAINAECPYSHSSLRLKEFLSCLSILGMLLKGCQDAQFTLKRLVS